MAYLATDDKLQNQDPNAQNAQAGQTGAQSVGGGGGGGKTRTSTSLDRPETERFRLVLG